MSMEERLAGIKLGAAPILTLDDPRAQDPELVGAKAAALAKAAAATLPVLPGFVLTTAACALIADDRPGPELLTALQAAWEGLSKDGASTLVVRSSSQAEDGSDSSMAGMFTSVLGVGDWTAFIEALSAVLASGRRTLVDAPMAVLVQPQLEVARGGVMFGVDPITGRDHRVIVSAVLGGPDKLVSGAVQGTRYELTRTGRAASVDGDNPSLLSLPQRHRLVRLASRAEQTFGGPQDVEWAFDLEGRLWLLQSRPITTTVERVEGRGPIFGPGPLAESFPFPLTPLEEELWVPPMTRAIEHALALAGAASRRSLRRSPIVITVGGRVAVDLQMFGTAPIKHGFLKRLDPRPRFRRLGASWRVGRLRAALPSLIADVLESIDEQLGNVGPTYAMTDAELITLLKQGTLALTAVHGHEILAGLLMDKDASAPTAASLALRVLTQARAEGLRDDEIIASYPSVLALLPPSIERRELPPAPGWLPDHDTGCDPLGAARESLRLRVRLTQELMARAARTLGERLETAGALRTADEIRWLSLAEVEAAVDGALVALDIHERRAAGNSAPLPAVFKLSESGNPIPIRPKRAQQAQGAGGGRGFGVVADPNDPRPGEVLVVRNLEPQLAPLLPGLGGLVAETGSVLSHLAILAREFGVPTVVGVRDAVDRFPPGTSLVIDGTSGDVEVAA